MGLFYLLSKMPRPRRNFSKSVKTPRRPFEKERLDHELKLLGEYGLRCKREVWRVHTALGKIRKAARILLTLDEKEPRRIFEGGALMRRLHRYGVLDEDRNKLDYVLALKVNDFLERRLSPSLQARSCQVHPSRSCAYS